LYTHETVPSGVVCGSLVMVIGRMKRRV